MLLCQTALYSRNGQIQKEPANETGRLLQEEIFRRFRGGTDLWLLSPGFCDNQTIFSPSLDFWHNFAGLSLVFLHILKSDQKKINKPNQASLLIIPASLISNRANEIGRFSPEINLSHIQEQIQGKMPCRETKTG